MLQFKTHETTVITWLLTFGCHCTRVNFKFKQTLKYLQQQQPPSPPQAPPLEMNDTILLLLVYSKPTTSFCIKSITNMFNVHTVALNCASLSGSVLLDIQLLIGYKKLGLFISLSIG
jgi:hypothetical protein